MASNLVQLDDPRFLDGKSNSRSFIHALMGSSTSVAFADLKPFSYRGLPSLWISEEVVLALAAPFAFSLVRYFPNHRPSLDSPFVDIFEESPIVPVWFSFPNMCPHFFLPRILHGLGSLFGHPLRTDNATAIGSRPSIDRVLVELDITKRYPDKDANHRPNVACVGDSLDVNMDSHGNVSLTLHNVVVIGDEGRSGNVLADDVGNDMFINLVSSEPLVTSLATAKKGNCVIENGVGINWMGHVVNSYGNDVSPSLDLADPVKDAIQGNANLEANQLRIIPSVESPHANLSIVVQEDHCPINMVVLDDFSIGTFVVSHVLSSEPALATMDVQPLVDILVSLISNDELNAHLSVNMKDSCLEQFDWLDGSALSLGKVRDDLGDDFHALYALKVGSVDGAF
ncbi:hypothetical protein M5K25_012193 [Dendrobium thyrsiflorum]|uniref:DUF4283 domain-containing protein n=1 Tax=Dendrobium thyrsiflorum TaxID=117978 RepID=A0ABD0UWY1_DENTH